MKVGYIRRVSCLKRSLFVLEQQQVDGRSDKHKMTSSALTVDEVLLSKTLNL